MSAKGNGYSDAERGRADSVVDGDEGLERSKSLHVILVFIRYRKEKGKFKLP